MNPSKALLVLLLTVPVLAQDAPRKPHAFFDRTNLALFSADALTRSLDAQSTRMRLTDPCRCYYEKDLPPEIVQSTPRMLGYSLGVSAAIIGASYLAHRKGFHKIERLLPAIDIAYDGRLVQNNYSLRPPVRGAK